MFKLGGLRVSLFELHTHIDLLAFSTHIAHAGAPVSGSTSLDTAAEAIFQARGSLDIWGLLVGDLKPSEDCPLKRMKTPDGGHVWRYRHGGTS